MKDEENKNQIDVLKSFCLTDVEIRERSIPDYAMLCKPFFVDNYLCASNGHIMVWIETDKTAAPVMAQQSMNMVRGFIERHENFNDELIDFDIPLDEGFNDNGTPKRTVINGRSSIDNKYLNKIYKNGGKVCKWLDESAFHFSGGINGCVMEFRG